VDAEGIRDDLGLPLEDGPALRPGDLGDEVDGAHEALLPVAGCSAGYPSQIVAVRASRSRCQDELVDPIPLGMLGFVLDLRA
jgi:hypothetical protein